VLYDSSNSVLPVDVIHPLPNDVNSMSSDRKMNMEKSVGSPVETE